MKIIGGKNQEPLYNLPAPHLEIMHGYTNHQIVSGESFGFKEAFARVPTISQELIDSGRVFVEFGRMMPRKYNTNTGEVNKDIRYWSNWVGGAGPAYSLSESSGDQYDQGGTPMPDRPNMIQITQQNQLIGPIPVWAFLGTRSINIFTGIFPNPDQQINVPVMVGTGYSYLDISQYGNGNTTPWQAKWWENRAMIITDWYARLVLFDKQGNKIVDHSGESNGVTYVPDQFPIGISHEIQGVLQENKYIQKYTARFTETSN